MLRSTIATMPHAVYWSAWSGDNEEIVVCSEKSIHLKPIQAGQRQTSWKAHDGIVLQVDWNPVNNLILSCGEDCKYKIWDSYGRLLFASSPIEHVVTAVAWAPNGKVFAVGSFNQLKLCDGSGWTYARDSPECGSVYKLAWAPDGTTVAAAGGNGGVVFSSIIERSASWECLDVTLDESNVLTVKDTQNETVDELEFRDRVVDFRIDFGHLVAVTNVQCHIYSVSAKTGQINTTPTVEDLKEPPTLILQCATRFALVSALGVSTYSYEGRLLSTTKYSGMRHEFFNERTASLSADTLVVIDNNAKTQNTNAMMNAKQQDRPQGVMRVFDAHSGKQLQQLEHKLEITHVALNQCGSNRKIAILDKNKDLYLCPIHKAEFQKLASMVDDFQWNDATDMIIALVDQKLQCFLYPEVVFVDTSLLPMTLSSKEANEVGAFAQLKNFSGSHATVRKADGSMLRMMVSPYPLLLHQHVEKGQWDLAIRLCRYIKVSECWACLAAMGIQARELNTVEIALAAIEDLPKVQFINHINQLPDDTLKNAELALFCKKPEEALGVLLSNKRIFRAIKMCIRMHRWDQALDIALQHKTHVDTVLAYRDRHLEQMKHAEHNEKFMRVSKEVTFDWENVKSKIAMEKQKEKA